MSLELKTKLLLHCSFQEIHFWGRFMKHDARPLSQQQATEILDAWKNGLKDFPDQKLIIHSRCKTRLPLHRALWGEPGREEVFSLRYRMREALRKSRQTYLGKMVKGAQGRVDEDHTGETDTQIQCVFCCQCASSPVLCDWINNPHTHRKKKSTWLVHKQDLPKEGFLNFFMYVYIIGGGSTGCVWGQQILSPFCPSTLGLNSGCQAYAASVYLWSHLPDL